MNLLVLVSKHKKDELSNLIGVLKRHNEVKVLTIEDDYSRIRRFSSLYNNVVIISDKYFVHYLNESLTENANLFVTLKNIIINSNVSITLIKLDENNHWLLNYIDNVLDYDINDTNNIRRVVNYISHPNYKTKEKMHKYKIIEEILLLISPIVLFLSLFKVLDRINFSKPDLQVSLSIETISIILGIFIIVLLIIANKDKLKDFLFEEIDEEEYKEQVKEALVIDDNTSDDENDKITAIGRMELNLTGINEFYVWTKKQTKAAFVLAISLIILGILFLMGTIVASVRLNLNSEIVIIGTISSAIIEFIGATSLVVYKLTLSQLNHYHRSLHEDERFLSSVNLINNLSTSKEKDEMIKKVIESELELNLVEVKKFSEDKNNKKRTKHNSTK